MTNANPSLDGNRPWPGLMSFDEEHQGFFHGRDDEVRELLRLVRRDALAILFGQSGLGKSSILKAGVFPRLRANGYFPIYVRLQMSGDGLPLVRQLAETLQEAGRRHRVDGPALPIDMSLWEYFHRQDTVFWSYANQILTPVLVFDQFEEVFTLGSHDPSLKAQCRQLIDDLCDLVENRLPDDLRHKAESDDTRLDGIDHAKADFRVVLCFREDYLAEFEGLKRQSRKIMHNRMRLLPMRGTQAVGAIRTSGQALMPEDVAERIVRFVSGSADARAPLDELEVEPSLLSLVCRELNEARIRERKAIISTDLIDVRAASKVIDDYYEHCFSDLQASVRSFVEDHLLTRSGFRDSCSMEEAIERGGVQESDIDRLVNRRLLRFDVRHGVRRIELSHDVLTRTARISRDARNSRRLAEESARAAESARQMAAQAQAEAERFRALHAEARHYLGLALAEKADRAAKSDDHAAQMIFASHALANLDPTRAPVEYAMALSRRLESTPAPFAVQASDVLGLRFIPRTNELLVNCGGAISRFDPGREVPKSTPVARASLITRFEIAPSGTFLAANEMGRRFSIIDLESGRALAMPPDLPQEIRHFAVSPSGNFVAIGASLELRVFRFPDMATIGSTRTLPSPLAGIAWARNDQALIALCENDAIVHDCAGWLHARSLDLGVCRPVFIRQAVTDSRFVVVGKNRNVFFCELVEHEGRITEIRKTSVNLSEPEEISAIAICPTQAIVALQQKNQRLILCDWATGRSLAAFPSAPNAVSMDFSGDGRFLAAAALQSWRCWKLPSTRWPEQAMEDEQTLGRRLDGIKVVRMRNT